MVCPDFSEAPPPAARPQYVDHMCYMACPKSPRRAHSLAAMPSILFVWSARNRRGAPTAWPQCQPYYGLLKIFRGGLRLTLRPRTAAAVTRAPRHPHNCACETVTRSPSAACFIHRCGQGRGFAPLRQTRRALYQSLCQKRRGFAPLRPKRPRFRTAFPPNTRCFAQNAAISHRSANRRENATISVTIRVATRAVTGPLFSLQGLPYRPSGCLQALAYRGISECSLQAVC